MLPLLYTCITVAVVMNHSTLLLLACLTSLASGWPAITPEQIGLATFPLWLRSGGMSFFAAGLMAGRQAALHATASDVRLHRPPVDYSFNPKLRHVKEGPVTLTSSSSPIKLASGLLSFPFATTFP